jgi:TetR/AcrR family transcriptional regulator
MAEEEGNPGAPSPADGADRPAQAEPGRGTPVDAAAAGTGTAGEKTSETKTRILEAAVAEFAADGLAGARTEKIAAAAGVNKALLYYYFESKEKLYMAALEMSAARIRDTSMALFLSQATAGERLLRVALNHFDRILAQQEFQSLLQQEMVRVHKGESSALPMFAKRAFEPVMIMYRSMVREGIASGELIDADWLQMHMAMLGANVFYFLSAPIWQMTLGEDMLTAEALTTRRKAVMDFLGQAIFVDRKHGTELAAKVFAETPMPEIGDIRKGFGRAE